MPTPARFCPAPVPAELAAETGFLDAPICFCDMRGGAGQPPDLAALLVGHQQQRRRPPGSAAAPGAAAGSPRRSGSSLEMFPPKKITPAAWPGADLLQQGRRRGQPRVGVDHPLPGQLLGRQPGGLSPGSVAGPASGAAAPRPAASSARRAGPGPIHRSPSIPSRCPLRSCPPAPPFTPGARHSRPPDPGSCHQSHITIIVHNFDKSTYTVCLSQEMSAAADSVVSGKHPRYDGRTAGSNQ